MFGFSMRRACQTNSRLPYWIQAICPRVFYITEKAWNYYPFTVTGESKIVDCVCNHNA